ncbi:tetratricopeptide repeat protein 4-like [Acanthaster planci]|uniref:Tetratricopeptide repeat protein 4-like n=1 Tax=Acanthaster planci TaxID=133434 RepID=A0A8B7Y845_ACAPL|nr:tetratricopeptide repeat protein 4-like [Acanthaster planci]
MDHHGNLEFNMAEKSADNVHDVGSKDGDETERDGKMGVDLDSMFDRYLDEAASHPKYANKKKDGCLQKENEEFLKNWEKEIDKIPAFMNEIPDDAEDNSLVAALQAIKYDQDDPPEEQARVHKEDGNQWFKKKKYKVAITAYTEGLKQNFEDSELRAVLYANRAAANFHLGNYRSSANDATEAVKHNPAHMKALIRAAECCIKLEDYDEAITWCDKALKITPDDKKVLELRLAAIKQQKLWERNKRKRKAEEKAAHARRLKIVEAIKSRNIQYGQFSNDDPKAKSQDQLILEAVSSQHPAGAAVTLDESGNLTWPVTFLYPEFGQSDFVQAFHEDSIFSDHLQILFEESAPWDKGGMYKPHTVQIYFHPSEGTQLVEVTPDSTLRATLQDPRYLVAKDPLFVILPKNSLFAESYLKQYTSLH